MPIKLSISLKNNIFFIILLALILTGCTTTSSSTNAKIQEVSDKTGASPSLIYQMAILASEANAVNAQYKMGLINESERDMKTWSLKNRMEESGVAQFIRDSQSNTRILNVDRFYKPSQCKKIAHNSYSYECVDGLESYTGRGKIIASLFLPSKYETFKADNCKKIAGNKYHCTKGNSGFSGKGLIRNGLFLPIYPK